MSHLFQTYIICILIWISTYSYSNIEWVKSSSNIKAEHIGVGWGWSFEFRICFGG